MILPLCLQHPTSPVAIQRRQQILVQYPSLLQFPWRSHLELDWDCHIHILVVRECCTQCPCGYERYREAAGHQLLCVNAVKHGYKHLS